MNEVEGKKYYSMEERQKRLDLETAPDTKENREKRAKMRAKESANYGELQTQFQKEHFQSKSGGRGSAGGGGMNPTDIEKVPGKKQLKMAKGGTVSASKRADGIAQRGKTKGIIY